MRVVSLLPSATEMLYALGVEPVGVSHECDYPPEAAELPSVIETHIDASASSADINEQVIEATDNGGVYEIDRELLAELDPDIVVSQGICDVCAVDDSRIRAAVSELGLDAEVVTSDPHSLSDLLADMERLGEVCGRQDRAASLVEEFEERIERVEAATPDSGPRVGMLDWLEPPMVAGHWVPGMVERCGAEYGLADTRTPSRPREWEEIVAYDPEVLVFAPCGFGLDQTRANLNDVTDRDGYEQLTAVQEGEVYAIDGNHYVNRPGPRLIETMEVLGSVLYPDHVDAPDTDETAVTRLQRATVDT
ncbi:cobalamin-binding protein [Halovenus salina]|uniref:Cobalamin-binding protein n=1 Tax=Halovenus salina TaxID=1510225 RepID=A0ABD5W2Q6_9EURY|nr:cobalamin-binding protein [Halovenus salina]